MNHLKSYICFVVMCGVALFSATLYSHPQHASYVEISINEAKTQLQMALRVIPEDMESAISRLERQPFILKNDQVTDAYLLNYLTQTFILTNAENQPLALKWLGKEIKYEGTWLYFTANFDDDSDVYLQNKLLMQLQPAYINHVKLLYSDKHNIVFSRKNTKQKIWPLP